MKKYLYLLLLPLCMGFVACSSDDDEDGVTISIDNLVGLWQISNVKGTSSETGSFNVNVSTTDYDAFDELDVSDFVRFKFDADGTFTCYTFYYGKEEWRVDNTTTYILNGETLTLLDKNPHKNETLKIVSLTSDQLVLHFVEDEGVDDLVMDITMKRIK